MNSFATMIEIDADHQVWNNELDDMKDEILEMNQKLMEVKDNKKRIQKEQFQNLFLIHLSAIAGIKNRMQKYQLHSAKSNTGSFDSVDNEKYEFHKTIYKMVVRQEDLYRNLKIEFYLFIDPAAV